MAAELRVAHVDGAAFQLAGVAGLPAVDVEDALGVGGGHEGHRVVGVLGRHGDGGHDQDPVGVDGAGLVRLGAAHHDAVGAPLHHAQVQVRVGLPAGGQAAVALEVGHGAVHGPVLLLHAQQERLEPLVVFGAQPGVHLEGGAVHGVHGVHADAALEAGGGLLAQQPLHLHLLDQVLGALVQVAEPVDGPAGEVGRGGHQVPVLGILGQAVGHLHGVHGGPDDRDGRPGSPPARPAGRP